MGQSEGLIDFFSCWEQAKGREAAQRHQVLSSPLSHTGPQKSAYPRRHYDFEAFSEPGSQCPKPKMGRKLSWPSAPGLNLATYLLLQFKVRVQQPLRRGRGEQESRCLALRERGPLVHLPTPLKLLETAPARLALEGGVAGHSLALLFFFF